VKNFLAIAFFIAAGFAHAQDFGTPGTSWIYSDHESGGGHHSYPRSIFSVADTVLEGTFAHIVIGDCYCGNSPANILYGLNRRVYFYNYQPGQFCMLYDFNLNAGESFMLYPQGAVEDSFLVVVDSTGLDTVNGFLRKTQFIRAQPFPPHLAYQFSGKVIEGIGSTVCLYPQYGGCDPATMGLRCYQDSVIGFFDTHLAPSCDSVYVISIGIGEIETVIRTTVSPNPFSKRTAIDIDQALHGAGEFELADVTGRIVCKKTFSGNRITLERNNLMEGIYFYCLRVNGGMASGKLIID
jgi:hypothetical protein